jgi:hypothetical protein
MNAARSKAYKPALMAAAIVLLTAVSFLQRELNRQRADPKLGLTRVTPLENAPPVLAFTTVALGGFRGLIANALWIRANDLQLDDKYFEMVQLADWITKLQPTLVQVWLVQSWNMAYNISVKFSDYADRWRWVQRGIELLRDDGLRYNPTEALLYRELAWFFQHKMGQNLDDAHLFYKAAWAEEMTDLFGGPRPDFDELLNPRTDQARRRVQIVREKYKMDPRLMKEADELYGPLEWRLPEAHAIYWATAGLKKSKKKDLITLRRVIYQSMQMSVLRGRLISVKPLRFGPDLDKARVANAAYEQMIEDDAEMRHAIKNAHRNFLREMVYLFYSHNRLTEAEQWLQLVRQKYPEAIPANLTLQEYAFKRLTENISELTHDRTRAVLEGMILQSLSNLALGEDNRAEGLDRQARQLWEYYQGAIASRREQLNLPPLDEIKRTVRDQILDPQNGFSPDLVARLRARLGLPAPTNSPSSSPPEQKP